MVVEASISILIMPLGSRLDSLSIYAVDSLCFPICVWSSIIFNPDNFSASAVFRLIYTTNSVEIF